MSLLCAFEASARHQSFTAAAAELHLTQSAVSRQIRALEERLGTELFVRERQTVRLSAAGQAYAQEIRAALARISNATLGFRTNPQGGSLNLAILPTFGTRWLAPRLPQFFSAHPGITINLTTRLSQFDFQLEAVDAAIHFGLPNWPGAELEFLMSETVVPACSPDVAARHGFARPEDLLRAPCCIWLRVPTPGSAGSAARAARAAICRACCSISSPRRRRRRLPAWAWRCCPSF
jgi:DNA-binding transcriptional LysR family regulator